MTTLNDVAKAAGVSLATASRAINGSRDRQVRPELREKVLAVARELHYFPNAFAQAMARGQSSILGLVVHDIADPFFSSIASGVMQAADEHRRVVTLFSTQNELNRKLDVMGVLRSQRVQSVILAGGLNESPSELAQLEKAIHSLVELTSCNVTLIGQPVFDLPTVSVDNQGGAKELAQALLEQGHRKFAILAGPKIHHTAVERAESFAETISTGGGEIIATVHSDFDRPGGVAATKAVLEGERPDVIFATNDIMAIGAMATLREAGLAVGDDIGVAGFDNVPTTLDVYPRLTTVDVSLHHVGEKAVDLTLSEEKEHVVIPTSVVMRESTKRL